MVALGGIHCAARRSIVKPKINYQISPAVFLLRLTKQMNFRLFVFPSLPASLGVGTTWDVRSLYFIRLPFLRSSFLGVYNQ